MVWTSLSMSHQLLELGAVPATSSKLSTAMGSPDPVVYTTAGVWEAFSPYLHIANCLPKTPSYPPLLWYWAEAMTYLATVNSALATSLVMNASRSGSPSFSQRITLWRSNASQTTIRRPLAAERSRVGPPISVFSMTDSGVLSGRAISDWRGYMSLTTMSIKGMASASSSAKSSAMGLARSPA